MNKINERDYCTSKEIIVSNKYLGNTERAQKDLRLIQITYLPFQTGLDPHHLHLLGLL